ncbi:hypothetical protein GCM10027446_14280 [Angustibacter peucedani]
MTTTHRDPVDLLELARPDDDDLVTSWSPDRAEQVLSGLTRPTPGRRPRTTATRARRRVALGAVAAAAAAVALLASTVLAPRDAMPQAQAVERLARTAASAPATTPGPHGYVHQVVHFVQQGRDAQTPAIDVTSESWVRADGTAWYREVSRRDPVGTTYRRIPPAALGDDPFYGVRPADYERWPTEPGALRRYLEAHVNRAAARDERDVTQTVFEGMSDRFGVGLTPPELNAAMIRVLGSLPEVRTTSTTYAGRPAVRLAFTYDVENALYFDQGTAQFLGETMSGSASQVLVRDVAGSVPLTVRERATPE